jgi:hypothetical protein
MRRISPLGKFVIPQKWKHAGLVLSSAGQEASCDVVGDPCIVWDEEASLWRMFLFHSPPGHGQAVCDVISSRGPSRWDYLGPLSFKNPSDLLGGATHKPFVVMLPDGTNRAAKVDGHYWLLCVSNYHGHKVIQRAFATRLAGPWILETGTLIGLGEPDSFDGNHTDAVTGYYFEELQEFFYFYMGYPQAPQEHRASSPYGSAQCLAVQGRLEARVRKLGVILPPCSQEGHWASGWIGGMQIFPGKQHRWKLPQPLPSGPAPRGTASQPGRLRLQRLEASQLGLEMLPRTH